MLSDSQSQLLDQASATYSDRPGNENEVLKTLNFILHDNRKLLESSVDIVSNDGGGSAVKEFQSSRSGRKCWKVQGSQDREYICLTNYCSCPSFLNQSKQANARVLCKHLLAIKLANMLGVCAREAVSDEAFVEYLCSENAVSTAGAAKTFRSWRNK
ncbi:hypothetical protein B484DRAFT_24742 [Ochromonadaceae sp. CCMP2298]|nr:hypothetical protein B484DRAFT_24742 [Ochromonadaceae sp. CCMP2298]